MTDAMSIQVLTVDPVTGYLFSFSTLFVNAVTCKLERPAR